MLADSAEGVGYLLKDRVADVRDFTSAVRRVAAGGTALDPEVVSRLVGRRRGTGPLDGPRSADSVARSAIGLERVERNKGGPPERARVREGL